MSVLVLMYHGLYSTRAELEAIDAEERPYAVNVADFTRQLDLIADLGGGSIGARDLEQDNGGAGRPRGDETSAPRVLLSFDDGHSSNKDYALPLLRERGLSGIFFITSDFVDSRRNYLTSSAVADLARHGMTIGAHGRTHRFLESLPREELIRELEESRSRLQILSGQPVETMSFPGGRYDEAAVFAARAAGYRLLFGSRPGLWNRAPAEFGEPIPRVAVRATTSAAVLSRLASGDRVLIGRITASYRLKQMARSILGNGLYHRLYALLKR